MSNLVNFLENLGQNARLRHASKSELYATMNDQQIDTQAQWAVLRGDSTRLALAMKARQNMGCLLMAPQAHAEEISVMPERFASVG